MDGSQASNTLEQADMHLITWAFIFAAIAILLLYFPKTIVISLVGGLAIGLFAGGFKIQDIF